MSKKYVSRLPSRLAHASLARTGLGLAALTLLAAACVASSGEQVGQSTAAATAVVPTAAVKSPLGPASPVGQITDTNGGCLDLPDGTTTNGTLLHIWACDTGWNQSWYVDGEGSIHYAADPFKCVDFPSTALVNGVPTDETQLQLWDCDGHTGPDQVWTLAPGGQIEFAADTAKCIELRNGSSANNTPVQIFDCNGTSGQTWSLVTGNGTQPFQLQDGNGACLTSPTSSPTSGTGLVLSQCLANGANQTFYSDGTGGIHSSVTPSLCLQFPASDWSSSHAFIPMSQLELLTCTTAAPQLAYGNGNTLTPSSGICVEARNGAATNGTVVQGFGCNGTTGQTWFPKPVSLTCNGPVAGNGTCQGTSSPAPCGESAEPACATTAFPDCIPTGCNCDEVNLTVINGACVPCGANGEVACNPVPSVGYAGGCNEGSIESAGVCGPCGAQNEPACQECGVSGGPSCPLTNDGCNVGTINVNQVCVCGATSQQACSVGARCEGCASGSCPLKTNPDGSGVVLVTQSSGAEACEECGNSGQPPCTTGAACANNMVAYDGICTCGGSSVVVNQTCYACGGRGEYACPGTEPCVSNAIELGGKCVACGGVEQFACGGSSCTASGTEPNAHGMCVCNSKTIDKDGECMTCGIVYQPCCIGASPCVSGTKCELQTNDNEYACISTAGSSSGGGGGGSCIVEEQDYYEACDTGDQQLSPVYYCQGKSPTAPAGDPGCVVLAGEEP